MKKQLLALSITSALFLTGCFHGDDYSEPGSGSASGSVSTNNHQFLIDDGLSTQAFTGADVDGAVIFAGLANLPAAARNTNYASRGANTTTSRDLAAFVSEREAPFSGTDAESSLTALQSTLSSSSALASVSTVSKQVFGASVAVATHRVTLSTAATPTATITVIANLIATNGIAGVGENPVTNVFVAASDELSDTDYTLSLTVVYFSTTDILVLAVVVPTDIASKYSFLSQQLTSSTNVSDGGSVTKTSDPFTVQAGANLADFLFVVDNSGSMSSFQTAISTAASAFTSVISNSGIDFKIGIVTTDSDVLVDGNTDGAYTSDVTEFSSDLVQGISGSGIETGIWIAEQSLFSAALGDANDGTSTTEGAPRPGASLSVIILSDEESQYDDHFNNTTNLIFDPLDNLFIDRDYQVYGIIDPRLDSTSQYDDLATATGGSTADINDTTVFTAIMENISFNAAAATSKFSLTHTPISSSISVTVDGASVAGSTNNGWSYNQSANSITFHGTALPAAGAAVLVSYSY